MYGPEIWGNGRELTRTGRVKNNGMNYVRKTRQRQYPNKAQLIHDGHKK